MCILSKSKYFLFKNFVYKFVPFFVRSLLIRCNNFDDINPPRIVPRGLRYFRLGKPTLGSNRPLTFSSTKQNISSSKEKSPNSPKDILSELNDIRIKNVKKLVIDNININSYAGFYLCNMQMETFKVNYITKQNNTKYKCINI